jgi:hypothetical protein
MPSRARGFEREATRIEHDGRRRETLDGVAEQTDRSEHLRAFGFQARTIAAGAVGFE